MVQSIVSSSQHEAFCWKIEERLEELRATYGAQDWLTVVGGVTGRAYRLAGLASVEFAALLRAQIEERGRLLVHLRRKPIMRLRRGFDGGGGSVADSGGLVGVKLYFNGASYSENEGLVTVSGRFPTALLVTGPLNRPVERLCKDIPRCLEGLRVTALRTTSYGLEFDVQDSFETLAPMPDRIADDLGVERQRHLGHIPWLGYEGPVPAVGTSTPVLAGTAADQRPPAARARAQLRLVASS